MEIPDTLSEIDSDWLGRVLGAEVSACRVVNANSGTTGRGVLEVEYADSGALPGRLFVKLPPDDEMQRAFVVSSGMGRRESLFYGQLASEVPVRVPRCYHSDTDGSGERYIMLLEHLEDSGCTFRNASTSHSLDYIRAVLASFARLHAAYWQTPRFKTDLDWLVPPVQHPIAQQLVASALEQFSAEMPPVFSAMGELYLDEADAVHRLWNSGTSTVIHGDVHDGNLFSDGGAPGFLDWALVARGPGMRDVGYFLAAAMSPTDREQYQGEMLAYYRDELLANGVDSPPAADLWLQYQWHAAYVWVGAAVTLAMGDAWQPVNYTRRSLDRINDTLQSLDSVSAIRSNLP